MIDVYWLSRHPHIQARGPWDTGMLERLFAGTMFDTGYDFVHHEVDHLEPGRAGIVVLPARHHADDVDWLNGELAKLERVLLILCGDEEAVFDWRQVDHGRIGRCLAHQLQRLVDGPRCGPRPRDPRR